MLRATMYQQSMTVVDPDVIGLAPDAFERHLPELLPRMLPWAQLQRVFSSTEGAPTRCPLQIVGMLLLQFRYDLSERELLERCRRDLGFRYALQMSEHERIPAERTLRRWRASLTEHLGDDFLFRLTLEWAHRQGLLSDAEEQAIDSTNTDCRGAVIDTFNLIAVAIRQLVTGLAGALGKSPEELAQEYDLAAYMQRSMKGTAAIDWSDEGQRNALLTEEVAAADRLVESVRQLHDRVTLDAGILEAAHLLQQVAHQDVEQLEDNTYRIAKGTARGRIISITDPEARHGRKSSSKTIQGFKTHVIGTIESQFVTGIAISDAATHDAKPTPKLIDQTEKHTLKPTTLVGDGAYGAGANIRTCNQRGVDMRSKPSRPSTKTAIPKQQFHIDLQQRTVTCPAGQLATQPSLYIDKDSGLQAPLFRFAKEQCQHCELKDRCCAKTAKGGGRLIKLSPYEQELIDNRAFSQTDEGKRLLRRRSAVERLISHLVRMGMRHARFFGMKRTQTQAFFVAAAYNLQRIITLQVATRAA